jgi:hypothetical protein
VMIIDYLFSGIFISILRNVSSEMELCGYVNFYFWGGCV